MPDWAEAILLGIIEGITEFLPVSSTGHLLIAQRWVSQQTALFNTIIQVGAALAVGLVFRERINKLIQNREDSASREYLKKLAFAFILTGIGGLTLKKIGLELPETVAPVAWATLIGGVIFVFIERRRTKQGRVESGTEEITWAIALAVAAAQLVAATFPGTSRSGATIMIALVLGMRRAAATEFSFLVGIPTLLSAGVYEAGKAIQQNNPPTPDEWQMLGIGAATAAVTAALAVRWLMRFIQTHSFVAFGWYRIILGATLLALGEGPRNEMGPKEGREMKRHRAESKSYSQEENPQKTGAEFSAQAKETTAERPAKSAPESARQPR